MRILPGHARAARASASRLLLASLVALSACDTAPTGEPVAPQDALVGVGVIGLHRVIVHVTEPLGDHVGVKVGAAAPARGIVVTATDVNSGEYYLALTNNKGQATLDLPPGSYLVHARNLQSAGPAVPRPLSVAPLPDNAPLLPTSATEGVNRLGVMWDPNAPGGSVPLDPANYSRLTVDPPLVLGGIPRLTSILLRFLPGAALDCTFFDDSGQAMTLPTTENVFVVLPHGSGPLPPVPPWLAGFNFPRGILLGVATVPAGQSACALAGFNQGGTGAILETNGVPTQGGSEVFIGLVPPSGAPSNAAIPLISQPRLASTHYLLDPAADATGNEDIGLVTAGWMLDNGGPSDDFIVATRFRGFGLYTLELHWVSPAPAASSSNSLFAVVECGAGGCHLVSVDPANLAPIVSTRGAIANPQNAEGGVRWQVHLPGVNLVEFIVYGGADPTSDRAPDTGAAQVRKDNGGGNTWIIPGD